MRKRLTTLSVVTFLVGLCLLGFAPSAQAAGGANYPWADSISNKALAPNELSLQQIFNDLGYGYINVATDETGIETWCVLPGQNLATVVIEVAGSASTALSGWYVANTPTPLNQLFDGSAIPGSSNTFSVPGSGFIGFYMKPGLSGPDYIWYSQGAMNSDNTPPFLGNHAKVFRTNVPHEYLVCWEDLPDGGDFDWQDLVLKISFANQIPVVTLPADYSVFQCAPTNLCFNISATDDNCEGDSLTLEKISGAGTFTTIHAAAPINTSHCFTPSAAGVYQFIFKVTDIVGAIDYDTLNVTVTLNQPPVVACPSNSAVLACNLNPICIPGFSATDPDGNLTTVTVNGVPLSPNPGSACFTPVAGVNTLTLLATDACGATASCVTTVTVTLNQPPVVSCPSNSAVLACNLSPICIPGFSATDPNGNLTTVTVNGVPLSPNPGQACFTPVAGVNTLTLIATDACGATASCITTVTVTLNQPPVANAGTDQTIFQCLPAPINIPASCTDPDGNLTTCQLVSAPGSYGGGNITFTPVGSGTYTFILKATDACNVTDYDTSVVTVTLNQAPVANAGNDQTITCWTSGQPICWPASCSDPDGNLATCQLISGVGTYDGSQICFSPTSSGTYTFVLRAKDVCNISAVDYDTAVVNVTINQPPVVSCPSNSAVFVCNLDPICIPGFSATDSDGNLTTVTVNGVPLSPNPGSACFTPIAGVNTLTLTATDACGATASCVTTVTVTLNQPPVVSCPSNTTVFACNLNPICIPGFGATDPDGNLDAVTVNGVPLVPNPGSACFTPVEGVNTLTLIATDACGATSSCVTTVTVSLNQPPVVSCHSDTAVFACNLDPICIPGFGATDPEGNLATVTVNGVPLSPNPGSACFTPVVGVNTLTLVATDACGATSSCITTVTVTLNQAPVADAGRDSTVFQCVPTEICIPAGCSDPDANLTTCELVSGLGTYAGSNICFTPPTAGVYSFILKATDACGLTDYDTSVVTVTLNQAPVFTGCPAAGSELSLFWGETFNGSVTAVDPDALPTPLVYSLVSFTGPITAGPFFVNPTTGVWSWPTETSNPAYQGEHTVVISVTDGCETATCEFSVYVTSILTSIAKIHDVIQGHYAFDSVYIYADGIPIGGFDFLIAYDASALTLHEVLPGTEIAAWEYFTYRFCSLADCNGACPSGLFRVVGIADMNNGFAHPPVSAYDVNGLAFILKFLVTNDRTYECQYIPVAFYWLDCGDNVLSSPDGVTAYLSRDVWWYHGEGGLDTWELISDLVDPTVWGGYAGWGGILESPNCLIGGGPGKPVPFAWMDMWDGGIDIVCADSIDARGDLNLNGIANEIADAVIYTQYFLYGIDAFAIGGANGRQASIAASDVNADGSPLSIGDLVYLVRVISGDALPYAKLSPFAQDMNVHFDGKVVATESNVNIGALLLTFKVGDDFKITNLTDLSLSQGQTAGELKVLLYDISTKSIGSGLQDVISIEGQAELVAVEAADYNGNMMTSKREQVNLPTTISLGQNYPNPFNPETVIEFALPTTGEITLGIYNVAGQLVKTLVAGTMTPAGYHQIRWDGHDANGGSVSSGVYFYKISTKDYSETRKMLLVK